MNPVTNASCRVHLLGGLRVQQDNRSITRFRTYKTGALLAYLAFYRTRTHPREILIDLFWPDAAPERGRNSLSIALSSIRHQIEPPGVPADAVLLADRFTVGLNPENVTTDVEEFQGLIARGGRGKRYADRATPRRCGEYVPWPAAARLLRSMDWA